MRVCGVPSAARVSWEPPTARMQACGGLMTAENSVMPNIPRFEILMEKKIKSHALFCPELCVITMCMIIEYKRK